MKEKDNNNQKTLEIQVSRLKECLKESGLSQREIAEKLNYTEQHISYVFTGKRRLTKEMAINLAELFSKGWFDLMVEMEPYSELSEDDKELVNLFGEVDNNTGSARLYYNNVGFIDYNYLLGISNIKYKDNILAPNSQKDFRFCNDSILNNTLKQILQKNGYILNCNEFLPTNQSIIIKATEKGYLKSFDKKNPNFQIAKIDSGETVFLSPEELFNFFNDCERTLASLAENFFQRILFTSSLSAARKNYKASKEKVRQKMSDLMNETET